MRNIFIFTLLVSLLSSPSWSESIEDWVERDGPFYKNFTDTLFTGEISRIKKESLKKGKMEVRRERNL